MIARLRRLICWLRTGHRPRAVWGEPLELQSGRLIRELCNRCGFVTEAATPEAIRWL